MTMNAARTNILLRVFFIKYRDHNGEEHKGSSFTIEIDGRQYLITARHIVRDIKSGDRLELLTNAGWENLSVNVITVEPPGVDISVLMLPRAISFTFDIEPTMAGLTLGQDVTFFGFPYGQHMPSHNSSLSYPVPLMKSGLFIGFHESPGKPGQLLIDGINNIGFSGGPLVFFDDKGNQKITGVVSSFQKEEVPVLRHGDKSKGEPEEVDTGQFVFVNTGIVHCFSIHFAIDAIKKAPYGPLVKK